MSTSAGRNEGQGKRAKSPARRSYVPATALAKTVKFDEDMMQVTFLDGRVLGVPLAWFPVLRKATAKQRAGYAIGGGGISLHWPELDEDLSIAGLLTGVDTRAG
jgi:hypothetical protein